MRRGRRRATPAALVLAVALAGAWACVREPEPPAPPPEPVPARSAWDVTRATVERLVLEERYQDADSALRAFEEQAEDSGAVGESRFRRVLLQVDPSNPSSTPATALEAIDAYLAGGTAQPHYQDVLILRRLAGELFALRNAPRPAPQVLGDTALLRQRTEEVARLRDSLATTMAELERIRRRLRSTRPDEPPPPAQPPPSLWR